LGTAKILILLYFLSGKMYYNSVLKKLVSKRKDTKYEKLGDISFVGSFPGYYDGRM